MSWIESAPLGPVPAGDVGGDDAVTEGYGRLFYRPVRPGVWATVEVEFYLWREGTFAGEPTGPILMERRMAFSVVEGDSYSAGREVLGDIRDATAPVCSGSASLDDVKDACAAFDAAGLAAWDGDEWPVPEAAWSFDSIEVA